MPAIRPAAVAGSFYPAAAAELRREIGELLSGVETAAVAPVPKALIAPHAGYIYSGPIAAAGYSRLAPARERITRVVLLGPSHLSAFTEWRRALQRVGKHRWVPCRLIALSSSA